MDQRREAERRKRGVCYGEKATKEGKVNMHRRSIDLLFNNKERKRVERASNGWAVHESTKKKKEATVEKKYR